MIPPRGFSADVAHDEDRVDPAAFMTGFGLEVRALRCRRGWTQAQLAQRVRGMTANSVSELERGNGNPSVTRVLLLADALGVSSVDLVAGALQRLTSLAQSPLDTPQRPLSYIKWYASMR